MNKYCTMKFVIDTPHIARLVDGEYNTQATVVLTKEDTFIAFEYCDNPAPDWIPGRLSSAGADMAHVHYKYFLPMTLNEAEKLLRRGPK